MEQVITRLYPNKSTIPLLSIGLEQAILLRQCAEAGERKTTLAQEFGISRETLYQYLKAE